MEQQAKPMERFFTDFFKVIGRPKSYINIFYLLMSFPLGIFYFVFLITGISLGAGLLVVFAGIPILIFMLYVSKKFMAFERISVTNYLKMEVKTKPAAVKTGGGFWGTVKSEITDPMSWKSMIFLLFKFPMGIFNFVMVVTLYCTSIAMIAAPVVYLAIGESLNIDIFRDDVFTLLNVDMSSFSKSIIYCFIGVLLTFVSMHITNLLAYINAKIVSFVCEL